MVSRRDDPSGERWPAPVSTRPLPAASRDRHRGGLFGRLLGPFFSRVAPEDESAERMRRAYAEGIVVHVYRSRRVIDPLFLLHLLGRLGLPKPQWMHEHYATRRPPTKEALLETVKRGEPALLFLRRPRTLTNPNTEYEERYVEALIALQRQLDRPILLLPQTLSWNRRAGGFRRTIFDVVLGQRDSPGRTRELAGFLFSYEAARFHVGAPVNLQAVLEREGKLAPLVIAKKIRWAILHHLAREEQIRSGPIHRPAHRTRQLVLNDPSVQRLLTPKTGGDENLGKELNRTPPQERRRRAEQMIKKLAADMRYGWLRVLDVVIDRVWNDIYDGIMVDREGLARVWAAARQGPVVLVPSHKSHVDYLVLSQVFFKDGMMPPHIAAGENLSFWPLGPIFRRGGAFFIRRSFGGDKLYSAICAAYVKRLLKDGNAVEFFIEGGRSRSGKLLPPKMGLLGMCVDPVMDGAIPDVSFIPVSISYEKIIEAKSYSRELEGGQKSKESVGALIQGRKVLRSRYGRVYVDFEEPISLRAFAAARGIEIKPRNPERGVSSPDEAARTTAEQETPEAVRRRTLVSQLGHRIVYGINHVTRVTPTGLAALVLLARTLRGTSEEDLHRRAERLIELLQSGGARLSDILGPATRRAALREALGRLAQDGLIGIQPSPDVEPGSAEPANLYLLEDSGRRALDFYKNNIVHFLVPASIVALAALARHSPVVPDPVLRDAARRLSRLLKLEFSFADAAFDQNFDRAARALEQQRILERRGEDWSIPLNGRELAVELAGQIAPFLEGYRSAAECLLKLAATPRLEKELLQLVLQSARRQVMEGRIRRAEAASQLTAQNAHRMLIEQGVLSRAEGGKLQVASEEAGKNLILELDRHLAACT